MQQQGLQDVATFIFSCSLRSTSASCDAMLGTWSLVSWRVLPGRCQLDLTSGPGFNHQKSWRNATKKKKKIS